MDVRIDGQSIVQDGAAEIPVANRDNVLGVIKTIPYEFWGTGVGTNANGQLQLYPASEKNIDARQKINVSPISVKNLDYAVKAAMCDGKGAAWTAEEQAAARERMGVGEYEDILDVTLEEDCVLNLDLNGSFRHLYVHINQSNVTDPVIGTFYVMPRDKDGKRTLYAYGPSTSTTFKNIAGIWSYYGTMVCRQMIVTNEQRETTGQIFNTLKVWDKNNYPGFPNSPFTGFMSTTTFKSGTRITIKGVRA